MSKVSILFLIISIFCFGSCRSQPNSKIISLIYSLNEKGNIEGKADTLAIEYLDKEGKVYKKTSTRRSSERVVVKTSLYNSSGKYLSQISDYGNGFIIRTDVDRDSNGFIVSSKVYDTKSIDTTWYDMVNNYNSPVRSLQSSMIKRDDKKLAGKFRMRFDQKQNVIEDTELDSLGNEITKNLYSYTGAGNLLKQTFFEKGVLISTTIYKYNGKRKVEAIQTHPSDLKKIKVEFIYQ